MGTVLMTPLGNGRWARATKLSVPVAQMYCAGPGCHRVVDLHVGRTKEQCVAGMRCPRCGGRHSTYWVTAYKAADSEGCIHVVDEEPASGEGCKAEGE